MSRCCPQECPGSLEPFCGPELAAPRARCSLVCRGVHESKVDLALGMIERAVRDGIPGDIALADAFYGNAHEFRETVRQRGVDNTPQPSELVGSVDFYRRISGSYFCTLCRLPVVGGKFLTGRMALRGLSSRVTDETSSALSWPRAVVA
ncbi:transposase [Sorangium sp. So ce363]|uniref:transposase n=1 Tax=Sorangium sp. So ce363 TaxID=3133304 RepID=UPI003F63B9C9